MSTDASQQKSWRDRALDFLFLQPPTTVLLTAILTVIIAAAYFGVQDLKSAVPAHLRQIHEGYMEAIDEFRAMTDEKDRHHSEDIKVITDHTEKAMDRMERLINEKHKNANPLAGAMN